MDQSVAFTNQNCEKMAGNSCNCSKNRLFPKKFTLKSTIFRQFLIKIDHSVTVTSQNYEKLAGNSCVL